MSSDVFIPKRLLVVVHHSVILAASLLVKWTREDGGEELLRL